MRDAGNIEIPAEAIPDAMLFGYSSGFVNESKRLFTPDLEKLPEQVKKATDQYCVDNSTRAAFYIWKEYAEYFPVIVVLSSDAGKKRFDREKRKFLRRVGFIRDPSWVQHGGALLCDKQGKWYFLSPANYDASVSDTPLTHHYMANSLEEMVGILNSKEGSLWPSAQQIEERLKDGRLPYSAVVKEDEKQSRDLISLTAEERNNLGLSSEESVIVPHLHTKIVDESKGLVDLVMEKEEIGMPESATSEHEGN